jgi:hypothetical protein
VLLETKPWIQFGSPSIGGESAGQETYAAPSPAYGAEIVYYLPPGTQGPARVAVLNANGDTLFVNNNAPSGPGVQRVLWNYRPRPAPRTLSPAERRDSTAMERRLTFVVDSLIKAGRDSAAINRTVTQLRTTPGRGGGGGGGGAPPVGNAFSERPGETPPQPPAQGGRAGGPGGAFNNELFTELRNLLRLPGGRASLFNFGGFGIVGGGGFGGPQPQPVAAGEYTVVVTVGSRTLTRKVRVERSPDLN